MKLLYLNYFSIPEIKSGAKKIENFGFSYSFLSHFDSSFEIIVIDCIGENDNFIKGNVEYRFRKKESNSRLKYPKQLNKEIIEINPDVILLQGFRFIHFADVVKRKLPNVGLIVQHHAEQIPVKRFKRKLLFHYNKRVDSYIFSSKELAATWIDSGIIENSKAIIELPEIATSFKMGEGTKTSNSFIWVGRLDENKDPLTVIKGIALYFKENKDATLRMFYHVETLKEQILTLIQYLDMDTQVTLVGKVSNAQLETEYQKSQFFLLGSHYEGGSLALMESMACGCIPVVSDIPANRKFTEDGKLGVLFEAGNPQDLEKEMRKMELLRSKEQSKKIRAFFDLNLSAATIAKRLTDEILN